MPVELDFDQLKIALCNKILSLVIYLQSLFLPILLGGSFVHLREHSDNYDDPPSKIGIAYGKGALKTGDTT